MHTAVSLGAKVNIFQTEALENSLQNGCFLWFRRIPHFPLAITLKMHGTVAILSYNFVYY